jgi:glucoamylase
MAWIVAVDIDTLWHDVEWDRFERADAHLATVRSYTPTGSGLSDQFEQRSGMQISAQYLVWSDVAPISCASARRIAAAACQVPRRS